MSASQPKNVTVTCLPDMSGCEQLIVLMQSMLERVTNEYSQVLHGWTIRGIVMPAPSGLGEMLVVHARQCDHDAAPFPWRILDDITRRTARATWRITAVVPDVECSAPSIVDPGQHISTLT